MQLPGSISKIALTFAAILGFAFLGQGVWIKAKANVAQILLGHAWAQTLQTNQFTKPWHWADTWPIVELEAPRLNKRAIILNGTFGEALAFGPGHMESTPLPGENGTAVIAGHRDTHFSLLKELEIGDEVIVTRSDGTRYIFQIYETKIVPWNASGLDPHSGEPGLALVTCYPFGALTPGPLRYMALAQLKTPT